MTQFHFIAGLPRSGSTLLAAILRQNPAITASMSSPVGGIFSAMQKSISRGNEAALFLNDGQRERLLRHIFTECYSEANGIVFDTNRMWPSKLPVLTKLFPDCKIVCCVRPIPWIMDSIESLLRKNPLELSGIFGFEPNNTVYTRVQGLANSNGLVGYAVDALREAFYGEHQDKLLLVEYEALAKHPKDTLVAIYNWLGIPQFEHNFKKIQQIPGVKEFDEKLGTPGLHSVRSAVRWIERPSILPPKLFNSFEPPFWRQGNSKVSVLRCSDTE